MTFAPLKKPTADRAGSKANPRRSRPATIGSGPLPTATRTYAENLFGASFSDVKVAAHSPLLPHPDLPAATIGSDIHLRDGHLSMISAQHMHYLGHELTHVLQNRAASQQAAASAPEKSIHQSESEANVAADRFVAGLPVGPVTPSSGPTFIPRYYLSDEHKKIGDEATGGREIVLSYSPLYSLTYGEIVAMVGDYFPSFNQMAKLAESERGRTMLNYVRDVKVRGTRTRASYLRIDPQAVEEAEEAFTALMANNQTHFLNATEADLGRPVAQKDRHSPATGPQSGAQAYRYYHEQALHTAYLSGDTGHPPEVQSVYLDMAYGQEAGADHYLTDAFSAGHVKVPRTDIKKYWDDKWKALRYPDFKTLFIDWAATQMAGEFSGIGIKKSVITTALADMFATKALNFGDLVSGVLHDHDNQAGVWVTVGTHKYQLYGDGYLDHVGNQGLALAKAAVQAGLAELDTIHDMAVAEGSPLDAQQSRQAMERLQRDGMYAAEHLMPQALSPKSSFNWRADDGGSVRISTMIANAEFQKGWSSLAQKIVEEARASLDTKNAMFDSLHRHTGETSTMTEALTRAAADRFLDKLESDPLGSLLDILGPGSASLVIDPQEYESLDPDAFDPDAFDGPIDDEGGL